MSQDWVQVRNCNWLHEAHFVRSVLESEGIEERAAEVLESAAASSGPEDPEEDEAV